MKMISIFRVATFLLLIPLTRITAHGDGMAIAADVEARALAMKSKVGACPVELSDEDKLLRTKLLCRTLSELLEVVGDGSNKTVDDLHHVNELVKQCEGLCKILSIDGIDWKEILDGFSCSSDITRVGICNLTTHLIKLQTNITEILTKVCDIQGKFKNITLITQALVDAGGAAGFTIATPGSYQFADNLVVTTVGGTGITITASDVTLDMCGFSLTTAATGSTTGISIAGSAEGVAVKNGILDGFAGGITTLGSVVKIDNMSIISTAGAVPSHGVRVSGGAATKILNSCIRMKASGSSVGVKIFGGTAVEVSRNLIEGAGSIGTGSGVAIVSSSNGYLVRENFIENAGTGISVAQSSVAFIVANFVSRTFDSGSGFVGAGFLVDSGSESITLKDNCAIDTNGPGYAVNGTIAAIKDILVANNTSVRANFGFLSGQFHSFTLFASGGSLVTGAFFCDNIALGNPFAEGFGTDDTIPLPSTVVDFVGNKGFNNTRFYSAACCDPNYSPGDVVGDGFFGNGGTFIAVQDPSFPSLLAGFRTRAGVDANFQPNCGHCDNYSGT